MLLSRHSPPTPRRRLVRVQTNAGQKRLKVEEDASLDELLVTLASVCSGVSGALSLARDRAGSDVLRGGDRTLKRLGVTHGCML